MIFSRKDRKGHKGFAIYAFFAAQHVRGGTPCRLCRSRGDRHRFYLVHRIDGRVSIGWRGGVSIGWRAVSPLDGEVGSLLNGEAHLHWMERWGLHWMEVYRSIVGALAVVFDGRKRHSPGPFDTSPEFVMWQNRSDRFCHFSSTSLPCVLTKVKSFCFMPQGTWA